mmetsp:Transcript_44756/g.43346  ORF Transcript_44756/g.43346 Transcript_44756/m.43346 type:complete len:139 (+) Transcript_44756:3-419(+)
MVSADLGIDDSCFEEFTALRMKQAYRFIIFRINDEKTTVQIEKLGDRHSTFDHFKDLMPKDQARYAVYEFEFTTSDNRKQSKTFFFFYAPDICDPKTKFIYAATKDAMNKRLSPISKAVGINDWADLDEEQLLKSFKA